MKSCRLCGELKPLSEYFNRKDSFDGKTTACKSCTKEGNTANYRKNKKAHYERGKRWIEKNKQKHEEYQAEYKRRNAEHILATNRQWKKDNPDKVAIYSKTQKAKNPELRKARTNIYNGLMRGYTRRSKAFQLLGADFDTVWAHLTKTWERRYKSKLTSSTKFEIDHIIPCSILEDHHYTNLQLLTPEDNRTKASSLEYIDDL